MGRSGFDNENDAARRLLVPNARLDAKRASLSPAEQVMFTERQAAMSGFWSAASRVAKAQERGGSPSADEHLRDAQAKLREAQRAFNQGPPPAVSALVAAYLDSDLLYSHNERNYPRALWQEISDFVFPMRKGARNGSEGPVVEFTRTGGGSNTFDQRDVRQYGSFFLEDDGGGRSALSPELVNLQPGELYLDVGTGSGRVAHDLLNASAQSRQVRFQGQMIGVDAVTDASGIQSQYPSRYAFVHGDIHDVTLPKKASLITDIMGALAYSSNYDRTLQTELDLLETGGRLYTAINPQATIIIRANGTPCSVSEWTAEQPGLRVREFATGGMVIEKTRDDATVGKLELAGIAPRKPPVRVYYEPGYADLPR